jgi:hypothetical protein
VHKFSIIKMEYKPEYTKEEIEAATRLGIADKLPLPDRTEAPSSMEDRAEALAPSAMEPAAEASPEDM